MDAPNRPVVPPAPPVFKDELPVWRLAWETPRNLAAIWSETAFTDLFFRRRALGLDTVLLNEPEDIRHVLAGNAANYGRPAAFSRPLRPLAGNGVLLAEGADWRRQRRMLAPIFTPAKIGLLLPHFVDAAEGLVRRLEKQSTADLCRLFEDATLDAVLRALCSQPIDRPRHGLADLVRGYLNGPGRPSLADGLATTDDAFPWLQVRRRRFRARWRSAMDAIIAERRASGEDRNDFLGLLLAARDAETGAPLDDEEVRDQIATMLVAGFETTSRLLFWAAYLLALDPLEQDRLRREAEGAAPPASLEDLQSQPRLRQTLLETLRLYPPVAALLRRPAADDVLPGGEHLPAGAMVFVSPWVLHRHRSFWDNPTAFMPERFAGKPNAFLTEPAFLPFGGGPRICIGASFAMAEAQIMLAMILKRFHISMASARPVLPVSTVTTAPDHAPVFRLERIA